jgi:hypothetical protein
VRFILSGEHFGLSADVRNRLRDAQPEPAQQLGVSAAVRLPAQAVDLVRQQRTHLPRVVCCGVL